MPLLRLPLWLPLSGQNVLNEAVHSYCTFFVHLVGDMAINIQGECCGSMAQMFLHRFNIITGTDGRNGKRMAQIVKTGVRRTNFCDDLFEFQIDGLMFQMMTQLISKHKTGILPGRTI